MPPAGDRTDTPSIAPDEAFGLLGDETRLQILQVLGEANRSLAFSTLFDRIDYETTANFSYHLEKLVGPFVSATDDGYELRQAGRRVVEAVLSGAVTETPVIERTEIDRPCFRCGNSMAVNYREERVGLYCERCGGTRGQMSPTTDRGIDPSDNILGTVGLPPAGVDGRSPADLVHAAEVWTVSEAQALARGICPRCGSSIDHSVAVCEDHDPTDGRCETCDQEFAATIQVHCNTCPVERTSVFSKHLLGTPALMGFMIEHGIDPIAPEGFHVTALEETILSPDPFRAEFTFTADDDAITLTVTNDLSVVEVTHQEAP